MMTLAEYVAFITPKVGQSDSQSQALCQSFIQQRYKMIYDMRNWKDAVDLVTGLSVDTTGVMAYPTGIDRIIAIRSTGDHMISPTDSAQVIEADPSLFERTGDPIAWEDFIDSTSVPAMGPLGASGPSTITHKIRVFPTPQVVTGIILQGKRTFTGLVNSTDTPVLRNIDESLLAFGTADMLQRQRQYGKAQIVLQEAAAALKAMVAAETERSAYSARVIPFPDIYETAMDYDATSWLSGN